MTKMREQSDMMMPGMIHRWPNAAREPQIPEVIELARCKACKIKVPKDQRRAHLSRCPKMDPDKLFAPAGKVDL